jgi:hypothetical protein
MAYMKTFLVITLVLVLGFTAYSLISSKQYKFYYFPETNMYYDTKKGQYIYSMDGGKTWSIMGRATKEIPEVLGEKVVIKSKSPNVWELNPEHRAEYNGVLTDVNVLMENGSGHSAKAGKGNKSGTKRSQTWNSKLEEDISYDHVDSSIATGNDMDAEGKPIDQETSIGISKESVLSRSKKKALELPAPAKREKPSLSDTTQKTADTSGLKEPNLWN